MTTWTPADLDTIGAADELDIATIRSDGSQRRWTPIWVVRVGNDVYVRGYRGRSSGWFRHATTAGTARVRAGGVEREVTVDEVHDVSLQDDIDDAYRAKYARYGETYLKPMTATAAVEATLRLTPLEQNHGQN